MGGKGIIVIFIIANLIYTGFWWRQYWKIYRPEYSWAWNYGYQEAVNYTKENYSSYDRIIFSQKHDKPFQYILFYWPWEPSYFQSEVEDEPVRSFDKFVFVDDFEASGKLKEFEDKRILFITQTDRIPQGGKIVKTIDFLHGKPAFKLIKYEK